MLFSTQFYNELKNKKIDSFHNLLNNSFFNKSLTYYLDNLNPRYLNIKHTISKGETLDRVLKKYDVPALEIENIKKSISKKSNLNKLKPGLIIEFVIDNEVDYSKQILDYIQTRNS